MIQDWFHYCNILLKYFEKVIDIETPDIYTNDIVSKLKPLEGKEVTRVEAKMAS